MMLVFAMEYQMAIKAVMSDLELGLRAYELSQDEWKIVQRLCNALKV